MRFLLTSDRTEGNIMFGYNERDELVLFEVAMPTLDTKQLKWFHNRLGYLLTSEGLQIWAKANQYSLVELHDDLSFERFWNTYNKKRDRDEALKLWNRLSDHEKTLVFASLPAYKRYIQRNPWYNQLYAKTYLSGRHWTDEWDKI